LVCFGAVSRHRPGRAELFAPPTQSTIGREILAARFCPDEGERTADSSRCAENTRQRSYSAGNIMLGVVCLDAGVVLNALIVLNQLGRDAIRKVRGHVIERTGF